MWLYDHVANKGDMLDGMVDVVYALAETVVEHVTKSGYDLADEFEFGLPREDSEHGLSIQRRRTP